MQSYFSHPLNRIWEKGDANISKEDLNSLKTKFLDEEVIGIITMEDVMEELLQVKLYSTHGSYCWSDKLSWIFSSFLMTCRLPSTHFS